MNGKKLTAAERQERQIHWWRQKAAAAPNGHTRALVEWDRARSVIAVLPIGQQEAAWSALADQIKLTRCQLDTPGVSSQSAQHAQARVRPRGDERTTNRKEGE